ncbi:MAG TPA: prephenate dehydrogenase [Candidatus Methanoperedenaceae archaeon]|nr:prephenate dehydrogenase [Candidatus Methanoperedenaceae archaeon]
MNILIIGGTGETGQWFVKFFGKRGFDVTVWGAHSRTDIAARLDVPFASDLHSAVSAADIVLVSVPIEHTEKMIQGVAPHMRAGSLLMDITSVKLAPVEAMKRSAPRNVEILGTHPMFGPTIPDIRGQTVILVPVEGRCAHWLPVVRSLYEDSGAHIEIMGAVEHDRMMAVVQGLTHFAYISIGAALHELDFNVAESRRFMSPVYEIMIDFVGRILGQNPYLYAHIQMNSEVERVHRAFIQECAREAELVKNRDVEGFVQNMKKAAAHFGDTAAALRRSDKLINSKISEFEELTRSTGRERALVHIYSGVVHTGLVRKVTARTVVLEKNGRTKELLVENVRLLGDSELQQWKLANLTHARRDISVLIPDGGVPETFREVISLLDGVVSAGISDTYARQGKMSVTYRITILGDRDASAVQAGIERVLKGLGCCLR